MKHIESILPEHAAFELDRIGREETDATASAALTALLHNVTGCAIPQAADLPQSEVEELVPLCLSILRRHWQTPLTALGDGTTPMSLADLLRQLIDGRVNGNEALGILPANANIPTAVAALRDRKIGGAIGASDGVSLVRLLSDTTAAATVTKITDNTKGWTLTRSFPKFSEAEEIELGCSAIYYPFTSYADSRTSQGVIVGYEKLKKLRTKELDSIKSDNSWNQGCIVKNCPLLEEWDASALTEIKVSYLVYNCPNLKKVIFGKLKNNFIQAYNTNPTETFSGSNSNLIHLELGAGTAVSLYLGWWNPSAETLANPEFLTNFKTYIANRLTDNGSGLTLTLSQAVRDAIQQDQEIVSIITSKGWTISPAPSV